MTCGGVLEELGQQDVRSSVPCPKEQGGVPDTLEVKLVRRGNRKPASDSYAQSTSMKLTVEEIIREESAVCINVNGYLCCFSGALRPGHVCGSAGD